MQVTIIIPTIKEAENLSRLLPYLMQHIPNSVAAEIIIADGNSQDGTVQQAANYPVKIVYQAGHNRAEQMNAGAQQANSDILYFLHADTLPPPDFIKRIQSAVQNGYTAGCFRLSFDMDHWFLNASAWFTRFHLTLFRFGDQSLFVTRNAFRAIGGYREALPLMEDQDIIRRLKKQGAFQVLQTPVVTSARSYRQNGVFYQQFLYFLIFGLFYLGVNPERLKRLLRRLKVNG